VVKRFFNLDSYFAVTAPGLEPFTAQELRALDILPAPTPEEIHREDAETAKAFGESDENLRVLPPFAVQTESGGITFKGDLSGLYRANLQLRTASRVLARLGNFFYATSFPELQKCASRLPWERFLTPGQPIAMRVTCHKSKLYHSDAVARTVCAALQERLGQPCPLVKVAEDTDGHPPQLVVVRLSGDKCTVSVDSSGQLLHKRGYRQAVAKAPLRETLAAALLLASGWDKSAPLLDPFCGSGTIAIEAALMALGIPPGLNRRFAFMDWPSFDSQQWEAIRSESAPVPHSSFSIHPFILASDRDAGAIQMAHENAERAGVADDIEFKCQAVSSITPPSNPGWVVTNPPYGVRVSEGKDLRNLYAQFGNVLRQLCSGWDVAVLCNDPILLGQMHLELDTSLGFVNGGIPVRVARGRVGEI
jgi:putative N6-adenine-specific DNA methylase